jgi:hypothetical protein
MSEFRSHDPRVSMWSRHFAPNNSDFRPLSLLRCAVDEGDLLAEVETASQIGISTGEFSGFRGRRRRWWWRDFGASDLAYPAAFGSSTPSIFRSEQAGFVLRFPRWYDKCFPLWCISCQLSIDVGSLFLSATSRLFDSQFHGR